MNPLVAETRKRLAYERSVLREWERTLESSSAAVMIERQRMLEWRSQQEAEVGYWERVVKALEECNGGRD